MYSVFNLQLTVLYSVIYTSVTSGMRGGAAPGVQSHFCRGHSLPNEARQGEEKIHFIVKCHSIYKELKYISFSSFTTEEGGKAVEISSVQRL